MATFNYEWKKNGDIKKHVRDNSSGPSDCLGMVGDIRWEGKIQVDFKQSQWFRTLSILKLFLRDIQASALQKSVIVYGDKWNTANRKQNENASLNVKWYVEWTLNNVGGKERDITEERNSSPFGLLST